MGPAALENHDEPSTGPSEAPQVSAAHPAISPNLDEAETAIEHVVTASRAIRERESQTQQVVSRVYVEAKTLQQKYGEMTERTKAAETALQAAETEIGELVEQLTRAFDAAKALKGLVEQKIEALELMNQRVDGAERRVNELSASVERVVASIHTNLPIVPVMPELQ
jgi:chromosome segregation ATPase